MRGKQLYLLASIWPLEKAAWANDVLSSTAGCHSNTSQSKSQGREEVRRLVHRANQNYVGSPRNPGRRWYLHPPSSLLLPAFHQIVALSRFFGCRGLALPTTTLSAPRTTTLDCAEVKRGGVFVELGAFDGGGTVGSVGLAGVPSCITSPKPPLTSMTHATRVSPQATTSPTRCFLAIVLAGRDFSSKQTLTSMRKRGNFSKLEVVRRRASTSIMAVHHKSRQ